MRASAALGALLAAAGLLAGAAAAAGPELAEQLAAALRPALPRLCLNPPETDGKGPSRPAAAMLGMLEAKVSADSLLDKLVEAIKHGIPEICLEPLDPLQVPPLGDFALPLGNSAELLVALREALVAGIGDLDGSLDLGLSLRPFGLQLAFDLVLKRINLTAGYFARTNNTPLSVWGNGTLGLVLEEAGVKGNLSVELGGEKPSVDLAGFSLTIGNLSVDIGGLYGGGLLSSIVTDLANIVIQAALEALKQEELPEAAAQMVLQAAEALLSGVPVQELRSMVEAATASPVP